MSIVRKIATVSLGKAVNTLINFLFLPYMARALSYEEYGTYGQVLLIIMLLSSIFSLGLHQVIYIHLNKEFSKVKVFSSNVMMLISLSGIAYFCLLIFSNLFVTLFNNSDIADFLPIYGLSLLFSLPYHSINAFLIYLEKVNQSTIVLVAGNLIKIVLVVISIQYFESLSLVFISILISYLLQFIVGIFLVKEHFKLCMPVTLMKRQLLSGLPMGITNAIGILFIYTDSLMVSNYLSVKEYAIYRNGAIEIPFISTIYLSVSSIVMPEIANYISGRKYAKLFVLKSKVINQSAMLIYPIMVFLLFYSREFIELYIGERYIESSGVFFIYCFLLLIRINDYQDILISTDKIKIILYTCIFALLLNVVLNYFLIMKVGMKGAAMSSVFTYFVLATVQLYISFKIIGYKWFHVFNLKRILVLLALCSLLMALLKLILNSLDFANMLKFTLTGVLYFSLVYLTLFKIKQLPVQIINSVLPKFLRIE